MLVPLKENYLCYIDHILMEEMIGNFMIMKVAEINQYKLSNESFNCFLGEFRQ